MLGSILTTAFLLFFIVHFFPTIIACMRGHHNTLAIFMVNLLFGWTIIGWCFAMVWACTAVRRPYAYY